MYKACAVIPVYNHGTPVRSVCNDLVARGLPLILVDDGSDAQTKQALKEIASQHSTCTVFTLEKNLGKGGAVSFGLLRAHEAGFSHALQVDADGQHDLGEILTFLEESKNQPNLAICGRPVYDESVPLGRKLGRKITNFWVAINTVSLDIPDAMCGFRMYPLQATASLLKSRVFFKRMEFDIEVLVRLHWAGLSMKFLPVKVIYPKGGISHFRMVKDNVAITWMHTVLFFNMLIRLPWLILRRTTAKVKGNRP